MYSKTDEGKQKLCHGCKLGRGHSFILPHLSGTWSRKREQANKKNLWAVKKDMSPCLPNEGREVLPNSTEPKEPPVCKRYLFTCPQILINARKKHFTSSTPPRFHGVIEQSIPQEGKVWGITRSVFPGQKSQLIWLVSLEKEMAKSHFAPFRMSFLIVSVSACVSSLLPISLQGPVCPCVWKPVLIQCTCTWASHFV